MISSGKSYSDNSKRSHTTVCESLVVHHGAYLCGELEGVPNSVRSHGNGIGVWFLAIRGKENED